MVSNRIAYIICETATTEPQVPKIISEKNNRVTIETILQDTDVKNRNGRWYSSSELDPELESARIKELILNRSFFGESGHPMSKDLARQQTIDPNNVSHEILKMWKSGKNVMAHVKGTPTNIGENFNNFVLDGTKVAFSLRALGSVENTSKGVEVKSLRIVTYDWVN